MLIPKAFVEVGGFRNTVKVQAVIDTGFNGSSCLPLELAVTLGLELVGQEIMELADGSRHKETVFVGTAKFLGEKRNVRILLTTSEDTLIGTKLLADYRLTIDFPSDKIHLTKSSGRRKS